MIKKLFLKYRELNMNLIFGVSTTLVNWIVYTLLVSIANTDVTPANAIAWFAAGIFAYITNKLYVFESKSWKVTVLAHEIISFFGARIASGVFEIFLPALLMKIGLDQAIFGIEGFAAKLVVSVLVIVLNYIFSKLFVFKNKK